MLDRGVWRDGWPDTVQIGGEAVPVRTDFRAGMAFDGLLWDAAVPEGMKVPVGLRIFYGDAARGLAQDAAWRAAVWFFAGGQEARGTGGGRRVRLYDFERDAPLLQAAFLAQYRVDLMRAQGLHWWAFRGMFRGLWSGHEIVRVMGLRGLNLAEVQGSKERARLARMKEKVRLEDGVGVDVGAVFVG